MKTVLALTLVLSFYSASAQTSIKQAKFVMNDPVVVGSASFGMDLLARLSYSVAGTDTTYTFYFLDQNFKQVGKYYSIDFSTQQTPVANFYRQLKEAFLPENAPTKGVATFVKDFALGDADLMITNLKRLRDMQVIISTIDGNVLSLTEKQVDSLFGLL